MLSDSLVTFGHLGCGQGSNSIGFRGHRPGVISNIPVFSFGIIPAFRSNISHCYLTQTGYETLPAKCFTRATVGNFVMTLPSSSLLGLAFQ